MVSRWKKTLLAAATVGGCTGTLQEKTQQAGPDAALAVVAPMCDPVAATTSDGHHHPGEDCMMCHHQGGSATPYTVGGTLYTDSGGAKPAAGVTMHFIDGSGTDLVVVTQTNGNFWSTDPLVPPVIAFGSLCPNVVPMQAPIATTDVGCNQAGCHTVGFRVHVP